MARKSRRRTRRRRKMRGGGMFDGVIAAAKGAGDGLKGMFGFNKEKKEEQSEPVSDEIVRTNASDDLSQPAPEQAGGRRRRRRSRRKRRKSKRHRSRKRRRTRRRRRR